MHHLLTKKLAFGANYFHLAWQRNMHTRDLNFIVFLNKLDIKQKKQNSKTVLIGEQMYKSLIVKTYN